ncbi:hypothetical protein [uncultured Aquimarina sp.]|uniref:NADase-type glycan-binding domain-containing protein n=1 Tax=uncultured Aquimarina sp. TaxID=575652 RepID=UPI002607F54C|nr:hypothetical protein [uncultured Aquimarina sp.]
MNKLLLSLLLFIFVCCKNWSQHEVDILNLQQSFVTKNETKFLNHFPKDFNQFHSYFGWNAVTNEPEKLYEACNDYINYWFDLLNKAKYKKHESNIIGVCTNGKWEADGVNYFRDKSINYIKEKQKYYLINDLNDPEAKSVLFFLFDSPHPQYDADFASNLSTAKQHIVYKLFKNDLFDHDDIDGDETFLKQNKPKLATVDSISIGELKQYMEEELPTIFDYYKHEKIDEVDVWSNKMFGRCCSNTDLTFNENLFFKISSNFNDEKYPFTNLSDTQYLSAFVFKPNSKVKIDLLLDLSADKSYLEGEYSNKNLLKPDEIIMNPIKLSLINGYVKSKALFYENGRVKEMKVYVNDTYVETIILLDTPLIQEFTVNTTFKTNDNITLEPNTYYKGTKYDDICISEVQTNLGEIALPDLNKKYNLMELMNKK